MVFKRSDFTISYKEFGNKAKQAVIIFPPGIGFSSRFEHLAEELSSKYYVITPDMPGVGGSVSKNGNLEEISQQYKEFLGSLNISNPIVIGYCHGGSIAINLSKIYCINKLILMGTGEYFNFFQKILLTILFAPTLVSFFVRKGYANILTKFSHFKFHNFNDAQLVLVNQRWMQTIWYTIPKSLELQTETLIISSTRDKVCTAESVDKLKSLYPNNVYTSFQCGHGHYISELKNQSYADIHSFL